MQPGEKLADGTGSEVFAWGDGRVIKLFSAGTNRALVEYEARTTMAAFEAGAPAPEVFGIEEVHDRLGIVLPRYDGRSLLSMLLDRDTTPVDAGATLARVHAALHASRHATPLWRFQEFVGFMLGRLRAGGLPADVLDRACGLATDLPSDEGLCHGDLHFGNVLITDDRPAVIDWVSAMNASPLVDVARQHLTLAIIPVPDQYAWIRPAAEQSFMRTYAELTGRTEDGLRAAIAPYVTIMAVMRIAEPACNESERMMLIDFVRSR